MLPTKFCITLQLLCFLCLIAACASAPPQVCSVKNTTTGEVSNVTDCNLDTYLYSCRNDHNHSDVFLSGSISNSSCPILPTPTFGIANADFTTCAVILIKAPASVVYDVIYDFDSYPEWNTFLTKFTLLSPPPPAPYQVGSVFQLVVSNLFPPSNTNFTSIEIITRLKPNEEVAWRTNNTAEHVNFIVPLGDQSLYINYETYYGEDGNAFLSFEPIINDQFRVAAREAKIRAESLYNNKVDSICPAGYSLVSPVADQELSSCCDILSELNLGDGICGFNRDANYCVFF